GHEGPPPAGRRRGVHLQGSPPGAAPGGTGGCAVKKFRFRYERLLSLARQERRQAALSLALALTAAEEAAAHREAAVGSLREARRQNHLRLREGAPGWLVAAQGPY